MVAIDFEMVGTGPKGDVSSLARCSIVNYDGDVLYDEYILPPCHIVDYGTKWSGICKKHMVNATPFKTTPSQILKILFGKIVANCLENATMSLKRLTKQLPPRDIQVGKGHSSVEDTQTTTELYKLVEVEFPLNNTWPRISRKTSSRGETGCTQEKQGCRSMPAPACFTPVEAGLAGETFFTPDLISTEISLQLLCPVSG
ncbi:Hypothetical predicted protein [Marmota monax]|uniref:Exonuclease domain-containing protein n=1 Tax=Marmota monax TaxID=9995 RepID=A0A5E4D6T5_MARMO|nr:Hypothetical predicted protein [Marmota monax]